jgi:hypothetical protein
MVLLCHGRSDSSALGQGHAVLEPPDAMMRNPGGEGAMSGVVMKELTYA